MFCEEEHARDIHGEREHQDKETRSPAKREPFTDNIIAVTDSVAGSTHAAFENVDNGEFCN